MSVDIIADNVEDTLETAGRGSKRIYVRQTIILWIQLKMLKKFLAFCFTNSELYLHQTDQINKFDTYSFSLLWL